MKWLILLLGIASNASASLLIKLAQMPSRQAPLVNHPWFLFLNWELILGIGLYCIAFVLYAMALKFFPLNVAHPMLTAGAIASVAILSVVVLDESFTATMLVGLGFIAIGIILLTSGHR
jgi:small multidrug resistance pump